MTFDAALDAWGRAEIQPQLLGRFELFEAGYSAGVAAERERCARVCEVDHPHTFARHVAAAIREGAPAREWRGLSEEEIEYCGPGEVTTWENEDMLYFARAIEAALREKNT